MTSVYFRCKYIFDIIHEQKFDKFVVIHEIPFYISFVRYCLWSQYRYENEKLK